MHLNLKKYVGISILCSTVVSCGINYEKNYKNIETALNYNKNCVFKIKESHNYLLYNQEAGLFNFLKNDLDKSLECFNNATNYYKKLEASSKVSTKKTLAYTILSDTLLDYEGSDYEANLVHYYSGLAYLAKSDLQNAYIEFKAVEEGQKFAEQFRETRIIASENNINALLSKYNIKSKDINTILEKSNNLRANVRSNFLNANSLYLAGIIREINNSSNEALVNYKQAYAIQPNNKFLLEDLYRLSIMYDKDYADTLVKSHKYLQNLPLQNFKNNNTVYLIYEQGYIPKKDNFKLSLNGIDGNLMLTINLPVYSDTNIPNKNVNLIIPTNNLKAQAEDMANIYKLASNNLIENYPIILARQIGKLATQIAAQKAAQSASQKNGYLGAASLLIGSVGLIDSSDLRSWRTLPSLVKTAKLSSNTDINQIIVAVNNNTYTLDLKLKNREIAIVYMFDTGYHLYTKILYQNKK